MKLGLAPLAQRAAAAARQAGRAKRSRAEVDRRCAAAILPMLIEAVEIGLDQALIAARDETAAVLKIRDRKAALRNPD